MSREAHVRFCEGRGVKLPPATRLDLGQAANATARHEFVLGPLVETPPPALPLIASTLRAWQQIGRAAGVALALSGLGQVAARSGAARRAGQCWAGQALLPAGEPLLRVIVPYDLPASLATARAGIDPAAFDLGLAEGQAMTLDQAVAAGPSGDFPPRQVLR